MKTTHCEICNKNFSNCNYKKHKCLDQQPKFKILESWKNEKGLYKCPKCEVSFSKLGLVGHYYRKHDERGINFLKIRKDNKKPKKQLLSKEEISKIVSIAMKKAYLNGNAKGWAKFNSDKSRRSYPEKFLLKVFENNDIFKKYKIEEKFPYGKYVVDFLIVELKLVLEVDGSQHFRTEKAIEHDKIRDEFFIKEGFKVYRIKWSDMYKNTKDEISELINFIENIDQNIIRKYTIEDVLKTNDESVKIKISRNKVGRIVLSKICECGNEIKSRCGKTCKSCYPSTKRKCIRPPVDILLKEVEDMGYCATGRKYGVSDNSIRKWIKIK